MCKDEQIDTQKRVLCGLGRWGSLLKRGTGRSRWAPLKVLGSRNTRFTRGQRRGLLETVTDPGGLTLSLLGSDNDELRPDSLSSHGKNR